MDLLVLLYERKSIARMLLDTSCLELPLGIFEKLRKVRISVSYMIDFPELARGYITLF